MRAARPGEGGGRLPTVLAVGLGPAGPELTTPAASAAIRSAAAVLVRTARHAAAEPLIAAGARALDEHYERAGSFEEAYSAIVEDVVSAAGKAAPAGPVAYCVPGSPAVLEATVERLAADPRVALRLVPGMSFLELAWARLGIDPVGAGVRLVDAADFPAASAGDHGPLLVAQVWSKDLCSEVKLALDEPPRLPAVVLHHLGLADERVVEVDWPDLDRRVEPDHLTSIYVPFLDEPAGSELLRAVEVVRLLRERCPWDAAQTQESLGRYLLEETYEVIDAVEHLGPAPSLEGADHLEEELGDLLGLVLFHARLGAEAGAFDIADVARSLRDKLVRRHPHVFHADGSPLQAGSPAAGASPQLRAEDVAERWERAKREEEGRSSVTDGIPSSLPALLLGAKLEKRAQTVGLGLDSTEAAGSSALDRLAALERGDTAELGELLLLLARLAARHGADPEAAARRAAESFRSALAENEQARSGPHPPGREPAGR